MPVESDGILQRFLEAESTSGSSLTPPDKGRIYALAAMLGILCLAAALIKPKDNTSVTIHRALSPITPVPTTVIQTLPHPEQLVAVSKTPISEPTSKLFAQINP